MIIPASRFDVFYYSDKSWWMKGVDSLLKQGLFYAYFKGREYQIFLDSKGFEDYREIPQSRSYLLLKRALFISSVVLPFFVSVRLGMGWAACLCVAVAIKSFSQETHRMMARFKQIQLDKNERVRQEGERARQEALRSRPSGWRDSMNNLVAVVQPHLPTRQQATAWTMKFLVSQITDLWLTACCSLLGISPADVRYGTRLQNMDLSV